MKRFLWVLLCVVPLFLGCEKDSEKEVYEYYVRYEYSLTLTGPTSGTSYSSRTLSINTDSGVINATTYAYSYSEIIGPVKKGFKASITLKEEQVSGGTRNLKIYVARGSEPFALKATSTNTASASYTID